MQGLYSAIKKSMPPGVNWSTLAAQVGVSESYFRGMKNKSVDPGFAKTKKICDVLGISLNDLWKLAEAETEAMAKMEREKTSEFQQLLDRAYHDGCEIIVREYIIKPKPQVLNNIVEEEI